MTHRAAPTIKTHLRRSGIILALGLAAFGLTQCRRVADPELRTDGSSASTLHRRHGCAARCNERYRDRVRQEKARYREALRSCRHDRDCRRSERAKHLQNLRQLHLERLTCKKSCYNEGGSRN